MTDQLTTTEVPCDHCAGTGAYTHSNGKREACIVCDGYGTLAQPAKPSPATSVELLTYILMEHEPLDWGPEGCRCMCGFLSNDNPRHQAEQVARALDTIVAADERNGQ